MHLYSAGHFCSLFLEVLLVHLTSCQTLCFQKKLCSIWCLSLSLLSNPEVAQLSLLHFHSIPTSTLLMGADVTHPFPSIHHYHRQWKAGAKGPPETGLATGVTVPPHHCTQHPHCAFFCRCTHSTSVSRPRNDPTGGRGRVKQVLSTPPPPSQ